MKISRKLYPYLEYINSNKFITPSLFRMKFAPDKSRLNSIMRMRYMARIGLLGSYKGSYHSESVYHLTGSVLRTLRKEGRALIRYPYPPKISPGNLDHDIRVIRLRIAFEKKPELKNLFWVSDHEMRSGISPKMKADFVAGELGLAGWLKASKGKKAYFRRCPDAYFETTLEGERMAFILEYVHKEYYGARFDEVIIRLSTEYPNAKKMILFRSEEAARRFIPVLQKKIMKKDPWYVGDFEGALERPFKRIWHHLPDKI